MPFHLWFTACLCSEIHLHSMKLKGVQGNDFTNSIEYLIIIQHGRSHFSSLVPRAQLSTLTVTLSAVLNYSDLTRCTACSRNSPVTTHLQLIPCYKSLQELTCLRKKCNYLICCALRHERPQS